jgi:hypothetical protein
VTPTRSLLSLLSVILSISAQLPADHFEKLLKATCPNHRYHVNDKLKECTMIKNYMTTRNFASSKKPEGDSTGKAATAFPEEKVVMSIYGGLAVMLQAQAHRPGNQRHECSSLGVHALVRIPDHF